ncbi:MAG: hemolysin family protein [Lachnospiraceae bacterium]|jgi:putative hemolysin|nr:hemolysin family protein [Lachnospiraceae bacterium]
MDDSSLWDKVKSIISSATFPNDRVKKESQALIHNVFKYFEKDVKDIMTHRRDIEGLSDDTLLCDALDIMLGGNYSRYPIYHEEIDDIIGTLHIREASDAYRKEENRNKPIKDIIDMIIPVKFVPETRSIDNLFREMQKDKFHIAIVLDEYGQTSGLVAMEDIIEELVGDIFDEYDEEEKDIVSSSDGSLIASGMMDLEDLDEILPIAFDTEDYSTLNGFMIDKLDRIPAEDENCEVEYEGYKFKVLAMDGNIIDKIKITKL